MTRRRHLIAGFLALSLRMPSVGGAPAQQQVLPFTSNIVTGAFRGTQHCFICDLGDRPAVLVFARGMDAPTGALLRRVRDAVRAHSDRQLFGWFVFLGAEGQDAESRLEESVYAFARTNDATSLPVSALGQPGGPPGYNIPASTQLTVLLFRQRKVLSRRTYTARELSADGGRTALAELPRLLANSPTLRSKPASSQPPQGQADSR